MINWTRSTNFYHILIPTILKVSIWYRNSDYPIIF